MKYAIYSSERRDVPLGYARPRRRRGRCPEVGDRFNRRRKAADQVKQLPIVRGVARVQPKAVQRASGSILRDDLVYTLIRQNDGAFLVMLDQVFDKPSRCVALVAKHDPLLGAGG